MSGTSGSTGIGVGDNAGGGTAAANIPAAALLKGQHINGDNILFVSQILGYVAPEGV